MQREQNLRYLMYKQLSSYKTLRDDRVPPTEDDADDIRGSAVYGVKDEKLGRIDDVIFSHDTGTIVYVVIDTGGWLSSKTFIVPADQIRLSAKRADDFMVSLHKQQIENFPAYNEQDVESQDKWKDYERRYRSKWTNNPVMHRAETDRNVTPPTAQMTQGRGATGAKHWEPASVNTPTKQLLLLHPPARPQLLVLRPRGQGGSVDGKRGRDQQQCHRHRGTLGYFPGAPAGAPKDDSSSRG
jgi:PRC-barrel domain